ncbi:MAG: phosphotransferase [Chloroflexi bacterium]|nr:phosphotransferase [Chloroflexota bacterium]
MKKGRLLAQGRTAEIFEWGDERIIKLARQPGPAPYLKREFEITKAIYDTGLPLPQAHEVVDVDGRLGIIFERIDGITMLSEMTSKPWKVAAFASILADLHTSMHGNVLSELPSLKQKLVNRINSASQVSASTRRAALERLHNLPDGAVLCHGDFHPDNVLISPRGAVIIDWNDAARGNPLADVAALSLQLKHAAIAPYIKGKWLIRAGKLLFHYLYLRRYMHARRAPADEIEAWRLPVAVSRLTIAVPEEQNNLLAIIRKYVP